MMRGFKVAFSDVNNRSDIIPDYHMEDYSVNYTGMQFSYNLTKPLIERDLKNLGVVYMMTPSGSSAIGVTQIFQELNITIPIISCSMISTLSNSSQYPMIVRPYVSDTYMLTILFRIMRYNGWTQFGHDLHS